MTIRGRPGLYTVFFVFALTWCGPNEVVILHLVALVCHKQA